MEKEDYQPVISSIQNNLGKTLKNKATFINKGRNSIDVLNLDHIKRKHSLTQEQIIDQKQSIFDKRQSETMNHLSKYNDVLLMPNLTLPNL